MVGHSFNPSTGMAEAGRSLSLRPGWSRDPLSGQPSLGSERQTAGEDETERGGHVAAPVSSKIWRLQSQGSGFRVKARKKWVIEFTSKPKENC